MTTPLRPPEGRRNTADIIGIGQQRAMTSWLHQILSAHPGTWRFPDFSPLTSTDKEAQFWTRNRQRGPDWYRVLMTPPDRRDRLSLDITPDYALMDDGQIAECKALSPSAVVICILRDPLARAISGLRMHTMWDSGNAAPEALTIHLDPETEARIARARLWDRARAAAHLQRWRRAWPDMLVLNYEDLAADPLTGALAILRACGLDPDAMPPEARAAFETRAQSRVWVAPRYPLGPDLLHYLHGATWADRQQTESETGFYFREFEAILQTASNGAA
jgi:hypothetical protein